MLRILHGSTGYKSGFALWVSAMRLAHGAQNPVEDQGGRGFDSGDDRL